MIMEAAPISACYRPRTTDQLDINVLVRINSTWDLMENLVLLIAQQVSIAVVAKTTVAFRCTGNATARKTVVMVPTSRARVRSVSAMQASSSASTTTARRRRHYVTVRMIAATARMRRIATFLVLKTNSNAIRRAAVFWVRGSVMATTTVAMVATRIRPFATRERVTLKRSLPARMDAASKSLGTATRIMIAAMDQTSRLTFAVSATVPPDGNAVPNGATIAAFHSGSSAMAKTIVAMDPMKWQNIAPNATKRPSFSVRISAAFRVAGRAISRATVPMETTKVTSYVTTNIANVLPPNSAVVMVNVFQVATVVTMTPIVPTAPMS